MKYGEYTMYTNKKIDTPKIIIKIKDHSLDSIDMKKIPIKLKQPEQLKKKTRRKKKKHETLSPFAPKKKSNFVTVKTSLKSILKKTIKSIGYGE